MNTSKMMEQLKYGGTAKCTEGPFKKMSVTVNEQGHLIFIEQDVAYDFWDMRFAECEWEMEVAVR